MHHIMLRYHATPNPASEATPPHGQTQLCIARATEEETNQPRAAAPRQPTHPRKQHRPVATSSFASHARTKKKQTDQEQQPRQEHDATTSQPYQLRKQHRPVGTRSLASHAQTIEDFLMGRALTSDRIGQSLFFASYTTNYRGFQWQNWAFR